MTKRLERTALHLLTVRQSLSAATNGFRDEDVASPPPQPTNASILAQAT